jgi:hypothetical protein
MAVVHNEATFLSENIEFFPIAATIEALSTAYLKKKQLLDPDILIRCTLML